MDTEVDDAPAVRRGSELPIKDLPRVRELAASIGCVLVPDMCALAGVKESTAEAWAKRGEGPPHTMLGNRRLYPIEGLRKFIAQRTRDRAPASPRSLL